MYFDEDMVISGCGNQALPHHFCLLRLAGTSRRHDRIALRFDLLRLRLLHLVISVELVTGALGYSNLKRPIATG